MTKKITFQKLTLDIIRKHYIDFEASEPFYPIKYYAAIHGENPNLDKKLIYKNPIKVFNNTFIPNGNAIWTKPDNYNMPFNSDEELYILSRWLFTGSKQKNGEYLLLNGLLSRDNNEKFDSEPLQICDGNYIAENCANVYCWIQKLSKDKYPINNSNKNLSKKKPYINDMYHTYIKTINNKDNFTDHFIPRNLKSHENGFGYAHVNYYNMK